MAAIKFKPGDIVEILNISSGQIYDIQSQTCKFGREKAIRDSVVGSRYEIGGFSESIGYYLNGWNHGGHSAAFFEESQLMLFKTAEE